MSAALGRAELLEAFELLDEELRRRAVRAEVFVVGGAAMAIAYDARRSTRDVDAIFAPTGEVRAAAASVAERLELEPGWLNDGAKAFAPGPDADQSLVYEGEGLSVAVASPRYLLAMKLLASRTDRDVDDIRTLYDLCGFTTPDEGLDLLASYCPEHLILPRVQFLLGELFPDQRERGDGMDLSR